MTVLVNQRNDDWRKDHAENTATLVATGVRYSGGSANRPGAGANIAAALTNSAPQGMGGSEPEICSDGPVVADYGKQMERLGNSTEAKIAKEVRHELLMLPYYSLFDDLNIACRVAP